MGECQRKLRIFSVYFWHSDAENEAILEAVLKRARTTKHPWLIACGANISPEDSEKRQWFPNDRMHQKECRRADEKMSRENGFRRCMIMSLLATAQNEKSRK